MRVPLWPLAAVSHVCMVNANVEKTIFLGPPPVQISNDHPTLDDLRLAVLEPVHAPILETQLAVQFPTKPAPRGLESWYFLRGLEEGRRYEVRICWPATSPTDFWLDTYTLVEVFDTADLISSLSRFSEERQYLPLELPATPAEESLPSTLFLRVQAAASFYSSNRTLMKEPPAVAADIILDPFILNILPRSLAPVAAYISVVSIGAWFLSGYLYRWLLSIAAEGLPKAHPD